jgi:hypothetical protein
MQDYSKILTERGLIAGFFGSEEASCEVRKTPIVGESEMRHKMKSSECRFGQPHARLFPYLGQKVRTPAGPGMLLQVFAERVTVLLDSELSRCSFFAPDQIEPLSWASSE